MISAAPLIKNDSRLQALVKRLRDGADLTKLSRELGYSHHVQLRKALKDQIGVEAYGTLMSARAKVFSKSVPVEAAAIKEA